MASMLVRSPVPAYHDSPLCNISRQANLLPRLSFATRYKNEITEDQRELVSNSSILVMFQSKGLRILLKP
jgi:hypothetical protein